MSDLNILIEHQLPVEEVKKRIDNLATDVKKEQSWTVRELDIDWKENEGTVIANVSGKKIAGTITITEESIVLNGNIPTLSIGFESKIESEIRERLLKIT